MTATMTAEELAARLDGDGALPFVLDVRAPDAFERWRVAGRLEPSTLNVPYWQALTDVPAITERLPGDGEVVVVCAHGGSSGMLVDLIDRPGVVNLDGGMDRWATTLVPSTLLDDGRRFVVQLDRVAKACLSYAIGERGSAMAVVDPAADRDAYLDLVDRMECEITDVFDTHLHADHISLGAALAAEVGATYRIAPGDADGATFAYEPLEEGQHFVFGDLELVVRSVATPGHTPGSTSLEVDGRFLLTGDAVFVSGVGRPDLGGETDPWARDLFRTIHGTLARLDHDLEVCPAHYTSRREARADGTLRRQLGDLLDQDPVVSLDDEDAFVDYVVDHLGEPPEIYESIRSVNLGWEHPTPDEAKEYEVGRNECALTPD